MRRSFTAPRCFAFAALVLATWTARPVELARGQTEGIEPVQVSIEPPARVVLGDRAEIDAIVVVSAGAGRPLLVTPTSEGPAIELVRGRLTRADADDPDLRALRFGIPFVARTVGTSVVRVRVDAFACGGERCRAIQVEASLPIEVLPR